MKSQGKYIEHFFLSNKSYFIVVSVLSKPCLSQFLEKVYYKTCSYCARVYEGAHACMCTCMWRPELNGRYLLPVAFCLETSSFNEPGAHQLARLASEPQGSICLHPLAPHH